MEYKQKSARIPRSAEERETWRRVIIVLEHCPLMSVQTDKGHELLSERHRSYHAKHKTDPAEWRPDVVHQSLLHLQDSPLNRAGMLQVFLRTKKGVCIAVDPRLRVPRHVRLFEKMMVMCLFKMKVRSSSGYLSLLRVVKNPVTDHMPAGTRVIRVEKGGPLVDPFAFCAALGGASPSPAGPSGSSSSPDAAEPPAKRARGEEGAAAAATSAAPSSKAAAAAAAAGAREAAAAAVGAYHAAAAARRFRPFALVVGGMSKGDVDVSSWAPECESVSVAGRGMSAAAVLSTLLYAFEEEWLREDNEAAANP